jgi:hypothetical protein
VAPIASIAQHHPAVDHIHTSPETVPEGRVVWVGMPRPPGIERDLKLRASLKRGEMFGAISGVDVSKEPAPKIYLTKKERDAARAWLKRKNLPPGGFILLVWRCRDEYKDYHHATRLYHLLRLSVPTLILEHELKVPGPSTKGLTIRQQAAIVSHAKLVATPDTGWLHVAGALRKPIFGLYGSQNGALRQAEYGVPGGWMQGPCPYGRQPCIEETCMGRHNQSPCLGYSALSAEAQILQTLKALPK